MEHRFFRVFMVSVSALAVVASSDAWAGRGSGGGRGTGARSGSFHNHHGFHRRAFVGGTFFFGAPYYPWPYYGYPVESWPYYGYPVAAPSYSPPAMYVEKYDGTPTPETKDWIYCPGASASYPDVQECLGGWQRVIENPKIPTPVSN
jgi:hypothetical protein